MGLKNIEVGFQVLNNNDPKNLVILDTSEWAYIKAKPSIIEITIPGFKEPVVHFLNKNAVNIFNSTNLFLVCTDCDNVEQVDLPDGVYEITIKGSPDNFQHTLSYLKTDKTRLELDLLFLKIDFCNKDVNDDLVKKIQKIDLYLKAAEANVRYDNICEAQELFFKAQDDINKLHNCKTCI